MHFLVTSASGANGNGYSAILSFGPQGEFPTYYGMRALQRIFSKKCPRGDLNPGRGGTSPNRGSITTPS